MDKSLCEQTIGTRPSMCKVCGKIIEFEDKLEDLSIKFIHKKSKKHMATIEFLPPLCRTCSGNGSLDLEIEWKDGRSWV